MNRQIFHRFLTLSVMFFFLTKNVSGKQILNLCCNYIDKNQDISNAACGRESSLNLKTSWDAPATILTINQSVKFELKKKELDCSENQSIITTINEDDDVYRLMPIGYLQFKQATKSYLQYIHLDDFCINNIEKSRVEVKICENDCKSNNQLRPCVRKCCPLGQIYRRHTDRAKRGCFDPKDWEVGPSEWSPHLYHDFKRKMSDEEVSNIRPRFIEAKPKSENFNCTDGANPNMFIFGQNVANALSAHINTSVSSIKFRLLKNGGLILRNTNGDCTIANEMEYCVDAIFDYGHENAFSNLEDEGIFFSCPIIYKDQVYNDGVSLTYGIIMLCSSPFLLITVIVYVILLEKQNVHGWTTMSHASTMFFFYIFFGISHIIQSAEVLNKPSCVVLGALAHFFYLSTFLWLTIICFDIWWTFRSIKPTSRSRGVKKYIYYVLVGWVFPLCFTIICLVLDRVMRNVPENDCIHDLGVKFTGYGRINCNIDPEAMAFYLFYPLGILLSFNLVFVLFTMFKLYIYQKGTSFAKENIGKNKQMLKVFIKLFFVMGISWIFEIVSWLHSANERRWYWIIFDLVNLFQSIAIFIIYVCKKDTLDSLEESHPMLKVCISTLRNLCSHCRKKKKPISDVKTEMEEMSTNTNYRSSSNKSEKTKSTE